jgi:hypothetical protein
MPPLTVGTNCSPPRFLALIYWVQWIRPKLEQYSEHIGFH